MALAEASRLTQPLPGGQEGATVRIHPINTGYIARPEELLAMSGGTVKALRSLRSPRDEWLKVPAPVFLLEHPGAGPILVDTGLHASVSTAEAEHGRPDRPPLPVSRASPTRPRSRSCASAGSSRATSSSS